MIKIVVLGAGGSGKDFFVKKLINKGAIKSISYTTRPIRDGEVNGEDYHFISVEEFKEKIEQNFWYEWDLFRPDDQWYYGSSNDDIDKCDLFIKTPSGVKSMKEDLRFKCNVIYLNIEESIRKERLEKRSDIDSVERRISTDKEAFKDFKDYDIVIKNFDF